MEMKEDQKISEYFSKLIAMVNQIKTIVRLLLINKWLRK